jgi:formamidopyrimidine-DNA glycosylase
MNSLTVINEEFEEELPDDCPEIVHRLMSQLKQALQRTEAYEDQLSKAETNDNRIKELMSLCQSKNAEIFALERKVKDLTSISEEKDKQIISMLSMAKEFKQLVESEDKSVQTDLVKTNNLEQRLIQDDRRDDKIKEIFRTDVTGVQKVKSLDGDRPDNYFNVYGLTNKKKPDVKVKPGGYYPLFLRKPREGFLGNSS